MRKLLQKTGVVLLTAAIVLLSVTENNGIRMKNMAVAAASDRITVKAASDFILKFPKNWENQYVKKVSRNKKHGSYVAFYSKKCYNKTREGWLFSIVRYKDASYVDMPDYELVGRWNDYSYVAVFPTDVQTIGATKAAQKQYYRLNAGAREAASSIQPVKEEKKGDFVYQASDFSLKLPENWKNSYVAQESDSCVAFYARKCYEEAKEGWLFSIMRFADDSYQEFQPWKLVGKWNGVNYVASVARDVPLANVSENAAKQYRIMARFAEETAYTIQP